MKPLKPKAIFKILFLLFLIVGTVVIISRHQSLQLLTSEGNIFGTTYRVQYEHSEALDSEIVAALQEVDETFSMFNDSSLVARLNRGEDVAVSEAFKEVLALAQRVSGESGGAYDVTVAPLVNLWGFGRETAVQPTDAAVDSVRQFVGYQRVSVKGNRLVKADARTQLDFSSVAKGYGVDCVARVLRKHGVRNFLIEIGGEVVAQGQYPAQDLSSARPWRVGISKPTPDGSDEVQTLLTVQDAALATSGNYRRIRTINGRPYSHTIDPISGRPCQHEILSATVLAPTCAEADAYATAFMSMGLQKAQTLLAKRSDLQALFIISKPDRTFATWATDGMKRLVAAQ